MKPGKTINDRLTLVRSTLGHSQQAFADMIGVSRSYLANIESGRKEATLEILSFLIGTMGVAPDYMMMGGGPMFRQETTLVSKSSENAQSTTGLLLAASAPDKTKKTKNVKKPTNPPAEIGNTHDLRVLVTTVDSAGRDNIALVSTRVAAGYVQGGFIEREFIRELPTFSLPDSAYRNGTFRAFQVSGDSMQPTLYEGDWVICRYVEDWARDIKNTYVYVVVTTDIPVVTTT